MEDLELIKKYYGERVSHICRELFPTILEIEGKLFSLLESNFGHTHFLIDDLEDDIFIGHFKDYIYNLIDNSYKLVVTTKTPYELMSEAGYILYECKTDEEIQSFKKYYTEKEQLCTFRTNRLKSNYVFFAVKKNIAKIKREDFKNPEREDLYGTSVISIQFSHGDNNILSIKNRYNHTVENPDATFSNNLDNIIPGLTESFERVFDLNITNHLGTDFLSNYHYKKANDNKYYKYNMEVNNVYYGPNNMVISNDKIMEEYLDKSRYIIIDNFVLDLKEKKFVFGNSYLSDDFRYFFQKIKFDKIEVFKINEDKQIVFTFDKDKKVYITIDKTGQMIEYKNEYLKEIKHNFLRYNRKLRKLELPNLVKIGDEFLYRNNALEEFIVPKLTSIGKSFMRFNNSLVHLDLPNIKTIGDEFLYCNTIMTDLNLPKVKKIDSDFMLKNTGIKHIILPNVISIGNYFLPNDEDATEVFIPKVKEIGECFLGNNTELKKIDLPNLVKVGGRFLAGNQNLEKINVPNLEIVGTGFLLNNHILRYIDLPRTILIGDYFLKNNKELESINIPHTIKIGTNFLCSNMALKVFNAPLLESISHNFMCYNNCLNTFNTPLLKEIGINFMLCNCSLTNINAPYLEALPDKFMENNTVLTLNFPYVQKIGMFCLINHPKFQEYKEKILKKY